MNRLIIALSIAIALVGANHPSIKDKGKTVKGDEPAADNRVLNNCLEWKLSTPNIVSGEYRVKNGLGQTHLVYCEFRGTYGYTFIPRDVGVPVNIQKLNPSSSEVLVRHRRANDVQYETTLGQITSLSSTPLSIQNNAFAGYQKPLNADLLGPYLYLGFEPEATADLTGNTQGYQVDGMDLTFVNCDGNGNSYFAFFFDPNNGTPDPYHESCCDTPLINAWAEKATRSPNSLPDNYFLRTEVHFGGCGGYSLTGFEQQSYINGAALGLRFECPEPVFDPETLHRCY